MNLRALIQRCAARLPSLLVLALVAVAWQALHSAAAFDPTADEQAARSLSAIRRAAPALVQAGDALFLSSDDHELRETLAALPATVYELDASDPRGAETAVINVLDAHCDLQAGLPAPAAYWIWTGDSTGTPPRWGDTARLLNFHFAFQAVLPYQGDDAFAIDRLLRLQAREPVLRSYCAARELIETQAAWIVLDTGQFSPWIRPVTLGQITWLPSAPKRRMIEADFAVLGMPPLFTYDVYWMTQVRLVPTWSFTNQDAAAYARLAPLGKAQDSLVLVERNAELGAPALAHLQECSLEDPAIAGSPFHQMCFK